MCSLVRPYWWAWAGERQRGQAWFHIWLHAMMQKEG